MKIYLTNPIFVTDVAFRMFSRNGEVSPLTFSIVHVTLRVLGFLGNHPNWNACQKSEEWYIREVEKSDDKDESNWNLKLGTGNSVYITCREWWNQNSCVCFTHKKKRGRTSYIFSILFFNFLVIAYWLHIFNPFLTVWLTIKKKFLTQFMKYYILYVKNAF